MYTRLTLLLPLLPLLGCGTREIRVDRDTAAGYSSVESVGGDGETDESGGDDTGGDDAANEAKYIALYDSDVMQEVRIELDADALRSLRFDPFEYVEGNVVINGDRMDAVGIRLKGSSSFQDFGGKPAFKVKFNSYEPGRRYATMERLTLNNMVGDPTQSREMIGYSLWRDQGLVVPRCAYAQVYVNDELFGLYLNLEPMDDHLIERHYNDADGDLWEGNDSADFTRRGVSHFELVTGPGDRGALDAVTDVLRDAPDDEFYEAADTVLDMDEFLDFWAYSIAIGNRDGYPYYVNDYFLYGDPADGRFEFSPWGMDESWDTGMSWSWAGGELAHGCFADADCVAALKEHTVAALANYEAADLPSWAMQVWELSDAAVEADPRRPYSVAGVQANRSELLRRLEIWPTRVRTQMEL